MAGPGFLDTDIGDSASYGGRTCGVAKSVAQLITCFFCFVLAQEILGNGHSGLSLVWWQDLVSKGCVAKSQCPSSVFGGTGHPWKCTSAKSSVIGWQDLPFQIYTDINIKVGLEGLGFRVFI